jgi:hypothetical protein
MDDLDEKDIDFCVLLDIVTSLVATIIMGDKKLIKILWMGVDTISFQWQSTKQAG